MAVVLGGSLALLFLANARGATEPSMIAGGHSRTELSSRVLSATTPSTVRSHARSASATASFVVPASFVCIAHYESGDQNNPPGNGDYGQWGFWQEIDSSFYAAVHLPGHASNYSKAVQLRAAELIQRAQTWKAWPISSRLCHLR